VVRVVNRAAPTGNRDVSGIGVDQISFLPADISSHAFNREVLWTDQRQQEILIGEDQLVELKSMIENIIEDGLNDFFFTHLCKYSEVWTQPVNFIGSVAFGFKDVLQQLCNSYEFELGKVIKNPMEGLVAFHR